MKTTLLIVSLFFSLSVQAGEDLQSCIDSQMTIALENWDTDTEENNMKELNKQIDECIKEHSKGKK